MRRGRILWALVAATVAALALVAWAGRAIGVLPGKGTR
jgi:hypothetical protein